MKAFSTGFSRSIRSRHAVITAVALVRPEATAAAISVAVAKRRSCAEHRRGIEMVGQRRLQHGRGVAQRNRQMHAHRRAAIPASFRCPSAVVPASIKASKAASSIVQSSGLRSQPGAPAAEVGDVGGVPDAGRLCQKAEAWAIVQQHGAEAKRRGHLRQQRADRGGRQRPDLAGDGGIRQRRAPCRGGCPGRTGGKPGWVAASRRKRPPRAVICGFSGRPDMCAPMQNSAVSSGASGSVGRGGGSGWPVAPTVVANRRCSASASGASRPSDQAGPSSTPPIGRAVRGETDRDGETGHVAEIGEIGERAQAAVGTQRIGLDLGQGGAERRRGKQQRIVLCEQQFGLPAGLLQQVKGVERIDGQAAQAQFQDRPRGGIQDVGLRARSPRAGRRCVRPPRGLRTAGGRLPGTA